MRAATLRLDQIDLDSSAAATTRVAVSPLAWVLAVVFGCLRSGTDTLGVAAALRAELRATDAAALTPALLGQSPKAVPDCLFPKSDLLLPTFAEDLDRLAATDKDAVLAQLVNDRGDVPVAWRSAMAEPEQWIASCVRIVAAAWRVVEPAWDNGQAALDREVERVGVAAAQGALPELLTGVLADSGLAAGDHFHPIGSLPNVRDENRIQVSKDGLLFVPLLPGPKVRIGCFSDDGSGITHVGWPLWRANWIEPWGRRELSGLRALVGRKRADILILLERPRTAGQISSALDLRPSVVTPHLDHLQAAGLLRRRRQGRHIIVERTPRGTTIIDLYSRG